MHKVKLEERNPLNQGSPAIKETLISVQSIQCGMQAILDLRNNGILFGKLVCPTERTKCSSDLRLFLKIEAKCREYTKFLRSLD